ncbi:hypothetical protein E4U13_002353 [Claviceps humidiphila]|uniref:Uncharacterized protein n=1 Tax=Claviceps humidiphila TaxID=1294629 RepID=A0A9P7Q7E8_9HYPO|nr:hypothetical protein E4U13_002353 [Claviceps humidiphila]
MYIPNFMAKARSRSEDLQPKCDRQMMPLVLLRGRTFYEDDGQQEWFMIDRDLGWDLQQDNLLYKILYSNLHQGTSM